MKAAFMTILLWASIFCVATGQQPALTSLRTSQDHGHNGQHYGHHQLETLRQIQRRAASRLRRLANDLTDQGVSPALKPKSMPSGTEQKEFRQELLRATSEQTRHVKDLTDQDPCEEGGYRVINDSRRSSLKYDRWLFDDLCDWLWDPVWYRFYFEGDNAVVPTHCVPFHHCHTDSPIWLDLQNQTLPEVHQEIRARACAHWAENCCRWERPITVRNCGDFFVYDIQPINACESAFCVESQD